MSRVVLRTARLALRRFTAADLDLLVELDSDPQVMRFVGNGVPTPRATVEQTVLPRILDDYERLGGLGWWAAERHDQHGAGFVGWLGLRPPDPDRLDELELGYRLRRAVWGRGLATEGATALVDWALRDLGARRVFARTMAVNTASRRVMERAGLAYVRTFHLHFDDPIPGTEHGEVEYELWREDWARRRQQRLSSALAGLPTGAAPGGGRRGGRRVRKNAGGEGSNQLQDRRGARRAGTAGLGGR